MKFYVFPVPICARRIVVVVFFSFRIFSLYANDEVCTHSRNYAHAFKKPAGIRLLSDNRFKFNPRIATSRMKAAARRKKLYKKSEIGEHTFFLYFIPAHSTDKYVVESEGR